MATSKRDRDSRIALPGWKFPTRARIRANSRILQSFERESFYRSIRFQLTAWYALVLAIVIVAISVAISTAVSQSLQRETDDRLLNAAVEIERQANPQLYVEGVIDASKEPLRKWVTNPPDISEFVFSGLWIQYLNQDATKAEFDIETSVTSSQTQSIQQVIFPTEVFDEVDRVSAILGKRYDLQTVSAGGLVSRVLVYPMVATPRNSTESTVIGGIVVGVSLETRERTADVVNRILISAGIFGVIVAAWAGWIVAGRALAPVKRIAGAAESISLQPSSTDSLAIRIDVPKTGDEVSHLASTFNTMLARIEDAFSVQRRFVADASHELRTPLTAIRGNVEVLLRQANAKRPIDNDILVESLDDVRRESGRMGRLIDDLLTLARDDARSVSDVSLRTEVSLDDVARGAFDTLDPLAADRLLVLDASHRIVVLGDSDRLTQVMLILGENALRHTPPGGTVTISVDRMPAIDGSPDCARITVRDTGEGISAEHLPHIFERFYRASGARERGSGGTGLGLSIALGIVRAHGGWIDVETAPERGSAFMVLIPFPC